MKRRKGSLAESQFLAICAVQMGVGEKEGLHNTRNRVFLCPVRLDRLAFSGWIVRPLKLGFKMRESY
jgi:hypothetical protein